MLQISLIGEQGNYFRFGILGVKSYEFIEGVIGNRKFIDAKGVNPNITVFDFFKKWNEIPRRH